MKQPQDASFDHGGRDGMVDLRGILLALKARIKTILAITIAVAVAATVFVFMVTPRFAGETQLLLENRDSVFTRTLSEREIPGGTIDSEAVLSQVQVVTSREVAREAIRRLGLVGNAEFDPLVGPMDPVTRVRTMLGIADGRFDGREEDRIFDTYYRALTVYAVPRSRVLAIEFRSQDPDLSARAANTIAEVYLEQLEEAQAELARAASNWLGANIEELRARVTEAEAAVETFRASSRLFLSGDSANISSQQLSDLNTRLAEARSAQADSEARAQLLSEMIAEGRAFEIPDVASNDLIGRLIEQRIDLRSQIALEQRTLLPGHPRILELRAQLADLDEQITASAERTVRILENEARIAASRVSSLEAALDAQMSVVAQANESEVQLRALEREARAEREQLENYLTRYREAIARGSQNATLPDARIVSRAVVPNEPVFPRRAPTIVLATLGAAFVATGGVVVAALISGGTPAAPAMAGAYAYPAQRRDDDPYPYDDARVVAYDAHRTTPPHWHQPGSAASAAGAAAVGAALADDRYGEAFASPSTRAGAPGNRHDVYADAHEPLPEPSPEPAAPYAAPSAHPPSKPATFIDIPLQTQSSSAAPPEEDVVSGVRKLGARLRGTLQADSDAGERGLQPETPAQAEPSEPDDAPAAAAAAVADDTRAVSGAITESPASDDALEAETPAQEPQRDAVEAMSEPDPEPVTPAAPAPVAKRTAKSKAATKSKSAAKPEPATEPEPASMSEPEPETLPEPASKPAAAAKPAAAIAAGLGSDPRDAAHEPVSPTRQKLPDTWQELAAQGSQSAAATEKTETHSQDVQDTQAGSTDREVRHEPRLRRKQAARKAAPASQDEAVQEDRLDAAWEEAVPVLNDGPPPAESVSVPAQASDPSRRGTSTSAGSVEAKGADDGQAAYDFSALLTRLRQSQRQDRGQRVLVSGLGDAARLRRFGEALAQAGARDGRCLLVTMQDDAGASAGAGLTDLIAERASFFDVIQRDAGSPLHRVERGRGDGAALVDDGDGLDIALTAFQHTYGLVFMLMPDPGDAALLQKLAGAVDTVVIASDREADDPALVDLYARVAAMGSADVVVAGVGRRAGVAAA